MASVRLRSLSRRFVAVLVAIAVVGALGACGDDDEREGAGATTGTGTATGEEPQQEPTGEAVATVDMSLVDFELDPTDPKVDEAGVVEFNLTNNGQSPHNLEVETPQGEFELEEDLQPGESGTLKAEISEPGDYVIYCPVSNHREMGMEGTVTVAGEGGSGGGGDSGGDAGGSGPGY
jgi:plastocyanin